MPITRVMACDAVDFLLSTALIYVCYISSGVIHEKMLKHSYLSISTNILSTFSDPIIFTLFPQLFATLIGMGISKYSELIHMIKPVSIPCRNTFLCSLVININMLTYNYAIMDASFPAVVMVKSCSMLSVVLVGVFCSRVKDSKLKLSRSKLWISLLVTLGIVMFNEFGVTDGGANDKAISWISCTLLVISLIGDGILADLQAQIKAYYQPSTIDMYVGINQYTFLIALSYAILSNRSIPIIYYIYDHPELWQDIIRFSILNSIGQLIVYRIIKNFKQHIPSFVIATRKCFTVLVNIVYFEHRVAGVQGIGIALVFGAVMLEVWQNYKEKTMGFKAVEAVEEVREEHIDKEPPVLYYGAIVYNIPGKDDTLYFEENNIRYNTLLKPYVTLPKQQRNISPNRSTTHNKSTYETNTYIELLPYDYDN